MLENLLFIWLRIPAADMRVSITLTLTLTLTNNNLLVLTNGVFCHEESRPPTRVNDEKKLPISTSKQLVAQTWRRLFSENC